MIDEVVKKAAKEFSDDIDFDVLASLYKESGWVEVSFNPHVEVLLAYEIQNWMKANCKGHYTTRGTRWLFEKEQDAAWFMLRWSHESNL